LTPTVWYIMNSYCLDRLLLVISTRKFCRGSGATSGRQGQWLLHQDNAPSHTSPVLQQFLAEKNILVITQPPYSLDLAPIDFLVVPYSKNAPQQDSFRNHGGHQIECDDQSSKDSQKKPSAGASNNGRIDGASVHARAHKDPNLKEIR
jgi:hypothetical protein